MVYFERQAADNKNTDIADWESLRALLYFNIWCNYCQQQFERKTSTYQACGSRGKCWKEPGWYYITFLLIVFSNILQERKDSKQNKNNNNQERIIQVANKNEREERMVTKLETPRVKKKSAASGFSMIGSKS